MKTVKSDTDILASRKRTVQQAITVDHVTSTQHAQRLLMRHLSLASVSDLRCKRLVNGASRALLLINEAQVRCIQCGMAFVIDQMSQCQKKTPPFLGNAVSTVGNGYHLYCDVGDVP